MKLNARIADCQVMRYRRSTPRLNETALARWTDCSKEVVPSVACQGIQLDSGRVDLLYPPHLFAMSYSIIAIPMTSCILLDRHGDSRLLMCTNSRWDRFPLPSYWRRGKGLLLLRRADTELAGRYTLSLFLQGRESKTERSFPYVSVSSATKYKMLNIMTCCQQDSTSCMS